MKQISAQPDVRIVFPKVWISEAPDLENFFKKIIQTLNSNDYRITSNLIETARQDLAEKEESYDLGDKSVRHKDYDFYNLLYSVLTDVYNETAASKKTYYTRKTDEITWMTRYKIIEGNTDTEALPDETEGLEISLFLVKR